MAFVPSRFNFIAECDELKLELWVCPPFLFVIMGFITIISMIATYILASSYTDEPQIAALIVILIAVVFLIIGNIIVTSFKRLADAHRMQSEFISVVSHQLRSPLSIIKWSAEASLRDTTAENPAKIQEFFDTVQRTTNSMIRMVNSLLEVSRIEAATIVFKKDSVSLTEITKNTVDEFRDYARASNIAIDFFAQENMPPVIGDRERIEIVIQNLIDNAIRYSRGKKAISINIEHDKKQVTFKVTDSGVGIPKDQQPKIFSKFFRAANGKKLQSGGTGIGLYIAKSSIEAMGGTINFVSIPNEGTTFWFTLPVATP